MLILSKRIGLFSLPQVSALAFEKGQMKCRIMSFELFSIFSFVILPPSCVLNEIAQRLQNFVNFVAINPLTPTVAIWVQL